MNLRQQDFIIRIGRELGINPFDVAAVMRDSRIRRVKKVKKIHGITIAVETENLNAGRM